MALPTLWAGFAIVDAQSCDTAWPKAPAAQNEEAKVLLKALAADVHLGQILHKRKWRVEVLRELTSSESKTHCGHNAGKGALEIAIQLRNSKGMWSLEACMQTMMHELSHMEHSNHGPKFKALEAELWQEYEVLANPFDHAGAGRRVGGTGRRLVPLRATYTAFGGSGHRLGGPTIAETEEVEKAVQRPAKRLRMATPMGSHGSGNQSNRSSGADRTANEQALLEMFPGCSETEVRAALTSGAGDLTVSASILLAGGPKPVPDQHGSDEETLKVAGAALWAEGGSPLAKPAAKTLLRYLNNILADPQDPKRRVVRTENPVFASTAGRLAASRGFLEVVGCEYQQVDGEDCVVCSASFDLLPRLKLAAQVLEEHVASHAMQRAAADTSLQAHDRSKFNHCKIEASPRTIDLSSDEDHDRPAIALIMTEGGPGITGRASATDATIDLCSSDDDGHEADKPHAQGQEVLRKPRAAAAWP